MESGYVFDGGRAQNFAQISPNYNNQNIVSHGEGGDSYHMYARS